MAKERSPDQTAVSISLSREALARIDARAATRGLSRSAFLKLLALNDASLTEIPPLSPAGLSADLTAEVYDFLLIAIPALQEYEAAKEAGGGKSSVPSTENIPTDIAESKLWRFFLWEMDEILRHKYLRSQELKHDIGLSQACKEWLQMHRALWIVTHKPEV